MAGKVSTDNLRPVLPSPSGKKWLLVNVERQAELPVRGGFAGEPRLLAQACPN